ncbi:Long-chain-fatty-acid--CoA ligase 1 [Halotydeus destructor]|nr:Long-chain-fatty-acid--CoA ligase 1 [Halotydeus destructor]
MKHFFPSFLFSKASRISPLVDLQCQSEVYGQPGQQLSEQLNGHIRGDAVRQSVLSPNGTLVEQLNQNCSTLLDVIYSGLKISVDLEVIVVENPENIRWLLKKSNQVANLKHIITVYSDIDFGESSTIELHSFRKIEELGKDSPAAGKKPQPDDLAVICYTSGTTGLPKGVMLTHKNYVSAAAGVAAHIAPFCDLANQKMLSFIPLANSLGFLAELVVYAFGGQVAIFNGDPRGLIKDILDVKPSMLVVVPKFLANIYNQICYSVKGNFPTMVSLVVKESTIWDTIVFKAARDKILGGNVKLIIAGGGLLSPTVLSFLRSALGAAILESYGSTEAAGMSCMTHWGDYRVGSVGAPLPCSVVKLIDIPEMGHCVIQNGVGEICIGGPSVFKGYFKNETKTRAKLDEDGWLRTGDIGSWNINGTLKILERKKHMIRLASGHYIAPEKIESIYNLSAFVSDCYVYGDTGKKFLVAVVIPEIDYLNHWCIQNNLLLNADQACKDYSFKRHVFGDMIAIGRREGLKIYEQIRDIYLNPRPFTVENYLLTPSLKTKRRSCKRYFRDVILEMYRKLESQYDNLQDMDE